MCCKIIIYAYVKNKMLKKNNYYFQIIFYLNQIKNNYLLDYNNF